MNEFGSPLAGCLPLLVQMPILFALFATLRGSPFADVPYTINMKVLPSDQIVKDKYKELGINFKNVDPCFTYNSGSNPEFLNVNEIQELII